VVAPPLPEVAFGQPLPDGLFKDLTGKASVVGVGNGFTNAMVQINSGGGNQFSTANVFSNHTTWSGQGVKITPFDTNTATQFRTFISSLKN
jgi:hypothetical protein